MDEPYYDDDFSESQGNIIPIIIIVGIIIILIIYFAFFRGCKKNEYKKGDKCIPITECDEQKNQIELQPATRISDRQCGCPANTYNDMGDCKPVTVCRTDQEEKLEPTSTSDRVCGCPSEYYESNGSCGLATDCDKLGKVTTKEPSDTTDRQCGACKPDRYYLSGDTCTVVRNCYENEYELKGPTPTSDRVCVPGVAVNMTGHAGQTCFLADDNKQHGAMGNDYRYQVISCDNSKKDGTVSTPSQFGLVSDDPNFSLSSLDGKQVKITADGKFCRLNQHYRKAGSSGGGTDGRVRITCDVQDASSADVFTVGKVGDKFSLKDRHNKMSPVVVNLDFLKGS
jgi:hypothetical protein